MSIVRIATVVPAFVLGSIPAFAAPRSRAAAGEVERPAHVQKESPLACNIAALTPKEKQRHFDELGPQLRSLKKGARELADGYEFEFPSDRATYRLLTEWADGERICCPFFDIELRSEREGGPVFLRLTGRDNVKKFIEVDGAAWLEK